MARWSLLARPPLATTSPNPAQQPTNHVATSPLTRTVRLGRVASGSMHGRVLDDRVNRCFVCGSKERRKQDCKLRAKNPGEQNSSGGGATGQGRGGSNETSAATTTGSSTPGGQAGAAATSKVLKSNDSGSSSMTSSNGISRGGEKRFMVDVNKDWVTEELVETKCRKVQRQMFFCMKPHTFWSRSGSNPRSTSCELEI